MPKAIESYGELTLAMKNFEDLHMVCINDKSKLLDARFIQSYQKAKANLGNLLVDLMLANKIEISVK